MSVMTKTIAEETGGQIYQPLLCKIGSKRVLTPLETLFRIELPEGRELGHRPGQFVQVSILGYGEAPISISSSPFGTLAR